MNAPSRRLAGEPHPDLVSEAKAAVTALVAKWRAESDKMRDASVCERVMDTRIAFAARALQLFQCAAELEDAPLAGACVVCGAINLEGASFTCKPDVCPGHDKLPDDCRPSQEWYRARIMGSLDDEPAVTGAAIRAAALPDGGWGEVWNDAIDEAAKLVDGLNFSAFHDEREYPREIRKLKRAGAGLVPLVWRKRNHGDDNEPDSPLAEADVDALSADFEVMGESLCDAEECDADYPNPDDEDEE